MNPIRVFIADDHELVRLALRTVIDEEPDLAVVGEAASGEEALESLASAGPDVVLLDVRMPGIGGVETCRSIRTYHPDIRVVVLTSYDDDEDVFGMLAAGASAYLMKDSCPETILQTIRSVAQGNTVLDPSIARRVITNTRVVQSDDSGLSAREREVLDLLARGMTNRQIAHEMWLSEATVKTHVSHILRKLGASDRAQAVLEAARRGLVRLDG